MNRPTTGDPRDPYHALRNLETEFKRFFGSEQTPTVAGDFPQVNIWTAADRLVVTAELPGVAAEDLDISIIGDTLTVRGVRDPETEEEGRHYHRREREHGPFARVVRLPFEVDAESTAARLSHGILEVDLRRPEAHKPHKIQVRGD